MGKLLIIGNGFDLAHNIPSKYEHFKQYLISLLENITGKNYKNYCFSDNSIITSDYHDTPENEILTIMYFLSNAEYQLAWSKTKTCKLFTDIIWKEIEKSVGELNYDDFSWLYIDESDDDKEYRANSINEDIFSPYIDVLCKIPKYFTMWINQINVSDAKNYKIKDLDSIIDNNLKILCFNYTDTLETVYNISGKNICYIHGKVKESDDIFFGHGNKLTYDDFINSIKDPNSFSVAEGYATINESLRKPVEYIIKRNNKFFEGLSNIDSVFSYGFSYGEVDEPYIIKITESVSDKLKWNIISSESKSKGIVFPSVEEQKQYGEVLKKCGYQGLVNNIIVNI